MSNDEPNGALAMRALGQQVGGGHYVGMNLQPIEFALANHYDAAAAAILKYIARHRAKNGLQDVDKAIHYVALRHELAPGTLIERLVSWFRAEPRMANWRRREGMTYGMADFIQANQCDPSDAAALLALEDWLWTGTKDARITLLNYLHDLRGPYLNAE